MEANDAAEGARHMCPRLTTRRNTRMPAKLVQPKQIIRLANHPLVGKNLIRQLSPWSKPIWSSNASAAAPLPGASPTAGPSPIWSSPSLLAS